MLDELGVEMEFTHLDTGADKASWGKHMDELAVPHCDTAKVLFLHRDPRDTVVSFFHEMTKRQWPTTNPKWRLRRWISGKAPPQDMARFVRSPRFGIEKVARFNLACREHLDAHRIAYEELRADPVARLRRIVEFLGADVPIERIEETVERNEFARMQRREANGEYAAKFLRPGNPDDPDSYKVRRGKIGGWRDEMSAEAQQFAAAILDDLNYFERMARS